MAEHLGIKRRSRAPSEPHCLGREKERRRGEERGGLAWRRGEGRREKGDFNGVPSSPPSGVMNQSPPRAARAAPRRPPCLPRRAARPAQRREGAGRSLAFFPLSLSFQFFRLPRGRRPVHRQPGAEPAGAAEPSCGMAGREGGMEGCFSPPAGTCSWTAPRREAGEAWPCPVPCLIPPAVMQRERSHRPCLPSSLQVLGFLLLPSSILPKPYRYHCDIGTG